MGDQPLDAAPQDCPDRDRPALSDWVRLLRVPHWVKSAIVFPAVFLAGRAAGPGTWRQALWAFAAFCLASSAVYAFNDVTDRGTDGAHPAKRHRPLAAGRLQDSAVLRLAALLAAGSLGIALAAPPPVLPCVGLYLVLNAAYSLRLKRLPVVDVCCIAAGFVLRTVAAIGMPDRGPRGGLLLASVFSLCLYVAVAKRVADLWVPAGDAASGRPVPPGLAYAAPMLQGLLWTGGILTMVLYGLFVWTVPGPRVPLALTLLPVAYSLRRVARLSAAGACREPVRLLSSDPRLVAAAFAWLALWAAVGSG